MIVIGSTEAAGDEGVVQGGQRAADDFLWVQRDILV